MPDPCEILLNTSNSYELCSKSVDVFCRYCIRACSMTLHNSRFACIIVAWRRGSDAAGVPSRFDAPAPRGTTAPPVAPQLSRASVACLVRLCYPSTVIWIYTTPALLSKSISHICGYAKFPTNVNGLFCRVKTGNKSFIRSALEFLIWQSLARRRVRHMAS